MKIFDQCGFLPLLLVMMIKLGSDTGDAMMTDVDICSLDSCSTLKPRNSSLERMCVVSKGLEMRGRCCVQLTDDDKTIGVDLSFCNVTSLGKLLSMQAPDVKRLNLTGNPLITMGDETFRGLRDLRTLSLPASVGCPGNRTWFNKTFSAWNRTETHKQMTVCLNQTDTCASLKTFNYTCPEHSQCENDGPGSFKCSCQKGWTGYKCIRLDHGRPSLAILCASFGSALILSAIFWFSERRFVIA